MQDTVLISIDRTTAAPRLSLVEWFIWFGDASPHTPSSRPQIT